MTDILKKVEPGTAATWPVQEVYETVMHGQRVRVKRYAPGYVPNREFHDDWLYITSSSDETEDE